MIPNRSNQPFSTNKTLCALELSWSPRLLLATSAKSPQLRPGWREVEQSGSSRPLEADSYSGLSIEGDTTPPAAFNAGHSGGVVQDNMTQSRDTLKIAGQPSARQWRRSGQRRNGWPHSGGSWRIALIALRIKTGLQTEANAGTEALIGWKPWWWVSVFLEWKARHEKAMCLHYSMTYMYR